MSKQQAILETLLGVAELKGDQAIAGRVRRDICDLTRTRQTDGYEKLWCAAFKSKRERRRAA